MSREIFALERARAQTAHERVLQRELLFGDLSGELLVVGEPPAALLLAAGLVSDELTLVGRGRKVREAKRWLERLTPCAVTIAERDATSLPLVEGPFGGALVWDLPPKEPIDVLERALFSVADGGRIFVSVGRSGSADQRIERLVSALSGGSERAIPGAPRERVALTAVRRATFPAELSEPPEDPLPITAVVRHQGNAERTERLLIDLMLRQVWHPARILVLDDALRIADHLPEDLWGYPASSPSEIALVAGGEGRGLAEGFNDALGAVETPFVAFFEGHERIAPAHLTTLGMHLERSNAPVVVADALELPDGEYAAEEPQSRAAPHRDGARLLRALLEGERPTLGAALWRTEALLALEGWDPGMGPAAMLDVWIRAASANAIPVLPLTLVGIPGRTEPVSEAAAWAAAASRIPEARWTKEFQDQPKPRRRAAWTLALAWELLREGDFAASLHAASEALGELGGPGSEARLAAACAAFVLEDAAALAKLAEESRDDREGLFVRALNARFAGDAAATAKAARAWTGSHPGDREALLAETALLIEPGSAALESLGRWARSPSIPARGLTAMAVLLATKPAPKSAL